MGKDEVRIFLQLERRVSREIITNIPLKESNSIPQE